MRDDDPVEAVLDNDLFSVCLLHDQRTCDLRHARPDAGLDQIVHDAKEGTHRRAPFLRTLRGFVPDTKIDGLEAHEVGILLISDDHERCRARAALLDNVGDGFGRGESSPVDVGLCRNYEHYMRYTLSHVLSLAPP